jgi:DNA-binding transcriptional LysR family regulator
MHFSELSLCMEFGSPEAIKSAVESGLGVSVVSRATVGKEVKLGTLVAVPLKPSLERPFSFVYQRQKFHLRAVEEFMNFMHEHCEKRGTQTMVAG